MILAGISVSYSEEIHPVILYTATDIPVIQSNISIEPYRTWFQDEQAEADRILALNVAWDSSVVPPETKAYYAKVLAFSRAFSSPETANRSLWEEAALKSLYHMPSGSYSSSYSSDLMVSEAVLFWAEAYDFLKGSGSEFSISGYNSVEATIRSKLKALRDYMARDTYELFPSSPRIGNDFPSAAWIESSYSDNHHVKLNAALASVSLVISDESGFRDDLDHALGRLRVSLRNLTIAGNSSEPAGGWSEGPNYNMYSAHQYLGAINALKNAGEADLYSEIPELVATHLLLPYMVMPDGYMPPWDDNQAVIFDLAGLLWSYHSDRPERDMLQWMWTSSGSPVPKAFRADYISGFDNSQPIYETPDDSGVQPSGLYAESGFARFRNNWSDEAVYLLFQSEHGEAHTNGQAHEHPDQNSFILHAFGELLMLDSGYGGWSNRDYTKYANNHNLILVNGEGPPGSSQPLGFGPWTIEGDGAFLEDGFTSPIVDFAVSQTSYEDALFTRHVIFPDHRYFLLFDTIESPYNVDYTLLLHGNGGGTSGGTFESTGLGGIWSHGQASVEAAVVGSSGAITFSTESNYHAVYSQSPLLTHTVLKATQQGTARTFLSILYPYPDTEVAPLITAATVTDGNGIHLTTDTIDAYAANRIGYADLEVTENGNTFVKSDAIFIWCDIDSDNIPIRLFMENGRYIADATGDIVTSSARINASLNRSQPYLIDGWLQTDGITELSFHGIEAKSVMFEERPVIFVVEDSVTTFSVSGEGSYQIHLPTPEVALLTPNGYENWNALTPNAISWTSQNISTLKLEYSLDNGLSWTTIVEGIAADTGTYSWALPDTSAMQCLVRITGDGDGTVIDQSDAAFSIYKPLVTVAAPNGGEVWDASAQKNIAWNSEYVNTINIEYSLDGGSSWISLASNVPAATGSQEITVPDTTSSDCLVRVTDTESSIVSDQSDSTFTIRDNPTYEKSVTILSPNGGEVWKAGTKQNIIWECSNILNLDIEYSLDYGENWTFITNYEIVFITVPENPSQFSYSWEVPDTASTTCLIRITGKDDPMVTDQSDATFTIESAEPNGVESGPALYFSAACYPNPFNARTTISYQLPHPADVLITIFNSLGQQVWNYRQSGMEQGFHNVQFDASNLTSGLYFYRIDTGGASLTGKMLYMK